MLDRLRFQEIEKAVFRVREEGQYGTRYLKKGEPLLIMDNASLSNFIVNNRVKNIVGRSTEAATATIRNVSFSLSNGQIMLDIFNSIFGTTSFDEKTTFTVNDTVLLNDEDTFEFPTEPVNKPILYLTDDYGRLTRIAENQYEVEDKKVTFIHPISQLITYVYDEAVEGKYKASIKQIGEEMITTLEMQCWAMDIMTEEKKRVLIKFNKAVLGISLTLNFNNSMVGSESNIHVQALPEDVQGPVNKEVFTIEVL